MQVQLHLESGFRPAPGRREFLWPLRAVGLKFGMPGDVFLVVVLNYKRLVLCLGLSGLSAIAAATAGLYLWLDRNPHNQIGFADIVRLPVDRKGFRVKLGDTAIAQGMAQLDKQEYTEAFHNLRLGVARSPANAGGRLALIRLLAGFDPSQAMKVAEEGIAHSANDRDFLSGFFALHAHFQAHTASLAAIEAIEAQARSRADADVAAVLDRVRVEALLGLGRVEEALLRFESMELPRDRSLARVYQRLHTDVLLRAGRVEDARRVAEAHLSGADSTPDDQARLLEVAIESSDADLVRSVLIRWRAGLPDDPAPYLSAYRAWHRLGRFTHRDTAEQDYLRVFGANEAALQAFAAYLVNLDVPYGVTRVQEAARSAGFGTFAYRVHMTEIELRRGNVAEAMRLLGGWEKETGKLPEFQRKYPEFLLRLARAASTGQDAQTEGLIAHISNNRNILQVPACLLALQVLENAGRREAVVRVARAASTLFPYADPLTQARDRAEAAISADPGDPVRTRAVAAIPDTADAALADLDSRIGARDLAGARELLRAIRSARPAWLAGSESALSVREIEIACLENDSMSVRTMVRIHLGRYPSESDALPLAELAVRLADDGRAEGARLLYEELRTIAARSVAVQSLLAGLGVVADDDEVLASGERAFARIDSLMAAGRAAEAERLLARIRRDRPTWATEAGVELRVREIRVRLALDQRPLALIGFRELVVQAGAARHAAVGLVRACIAAGRQTDAMALAREFGRLLPGDADGEALLGEAEAMRSSGPAD